MNLLKNIAYSVLLIVFLFLLPFNGFSQPIDPCTDPALPCPIDSNLLLLIVGALIIAAKKAWHHKKDISAV